MTMRETWRLVAVFVLAFVAVTAWGRWGEWRAQVEATRAAEIADERAAEIARQEAERAMATYNFGCEDVGPDWKAFYNISGGTFVAGEAGEAVEIVAYVRNTYAAEEWLVEGAGDGTFNGLYTEAGDHNGKPYYTLAGPPVRYLHWDIPSAEWWLGTALGIDDYHGTGADLPANPWLVGMGALPVPTVSGAPAPTDKAKAAICTPAGILVGTLVGVTEEELVPRTWEGWLHFTFAAPPVLVEGDSYLLAVWTGEPEYIQVACDLAEDGDARYDRDATIYDGWPDPVALIPTPSGKPRYSIYCAMQHAGRVRASYGTADYTKGGFVRASYGLGLHGAHPCSYGVGVGGALRASYGVGGQGLVRASYGADGKGGRVRASYGAEAGKQGRVRASYAGDAQRSGSTAASYAADARAEGRTRASYAGDAKKEGKLAASYGPETDGVNSLPTVLLLLHAYSDPI